MITEVTVLPTEAQLYHQCMRSQQCMRMAGGIKLPLSASDAQFCRWRKSLRGEPSDGSRGPDGLKTRAVMKIAVRRTITAE